MKITDIITYMVDFGVSNYIFVKVLTDEGIDGIGGATLEGKELSVLGANEEMKRLFVGEDPRNIEILWRKWHMTSCWKGVTDFTAISGIEQALWDITGKYYNTPVYRLWSAGRDDPRLHLAWAIYDAGGMWRSRRHPLKSWALPASEWTPLAMSIWTFPTKGWPLPSPVSKRRVRRSAHGRILPLMGIGALGRRRRSVLLGRWNPLT